MLNVAGKDASKQFEAFHNVDKVLKKFGPQLLKGNVAGGGLIAMGTSKTSAYPVLLTFGFASVTNPQAPSSKRPTTSFKLFSALESLSIEKEPDFVFSRLML